MKKASLILGVLLMTISTHISPLNNAQVKKMLSACTGNVVSIKDIAEKLNTSPEAAFRTILHFDKVVVDLYAPWCGPCKALAPALERMANKRRDTLFLKVDIEQFPQIAKRYSIRSIPTIMYFKNGQMMGRVTGNDMRAIETKAASL